MDTVTECECGVVAWNNVCPRCDEIVFDLIEQELLDLISEGGN